MALEKLWAQITLILPHLQSPQAPLMSLSLGPVSNPVNGIPGKLTVKREELGGLREAVQQFKLKSFMMARQAISSWYSPFSLLTPTLRVETSKFIMGEFNTHFLTNGPLEVSFSS